MCIRDRCSVCNNRSYTAGGYRWSFELKETLSKLKKKYKKVPVIQYSLDNVFIKEWEDVYKRQVINIDSYGNYHITTNYRVLYENDWLDDLKYLCEPTEYHEKRITVKFICDRGVSHEFVRHKILCVA